MTHPLILIPWQNDFIPALGDLLVERDDFSALTVLFPHNRPRRYLKAFFKSHPRLRGPVFLPNMTSISEFVTGLRREIAPTPVIQANRLDLVELLRTIVVTLRQTGHGPLGSLPELEREAFLPWGIRLAALMDDLLRQSITPSDLAYMEGEVEPYAAALLGQLGAIHREYLAKLSELGWTTPGLDWRFVSDRMDEVAARLEGQTVVAAGFYALSGAENTFFKTLWEADILLPIIHSDPALAQGGHGHPATAEHKVWLSTWRVRPILPDSVKPSGHTPDIRFREGFDRHSQLAALADDLAEADALEETAVLLPDEGALLPVLHHLPDIESNISMGYPLDRTSLARLLETILAAQENRLEDGRYRAKDIIALIRHPYLRLLGPDDKPLRTVFHVWEAAIRQGTPYIAPEDWQPPYGDPILDGVDKEITEPLRLALLDHTLNAFAHATTLDTLADALAGLATMLHAHGAHLWHAYLVDAECLFRLSVSVIPQLKSTAIKDEPFSQGTLFSLLRQMIGQERVSFEPEPLGGLQVLGMLETRLLHFKHLYLLDAVEDRLPGTAPFDPLLPDPLRKLLGLPDSRERDNVASYNVYRLLKGAQNITIYYPSGIQPGLLDSKSVRSRFVEQLLWEREQREQRIIEPGDPVIKAVTFPASPVGTKAQAVPVTDAIREALAAKLTKQGLSPTSLERYMRCPKQFHYTYLTRIRTVEEPFDAEDRSAFGQLVHAVLHDFFKPYVNVPTRLAALDPLPLLALFEERFSHDAHISQLPLDYRMALRATGRYRLVEYLANQDDALLIGLEQQLDAAVAVDGLTIPLSGRLDRIEQREEGVFILDYKTGSTTLPPKKCWEDQTLWDALDAFDPHQPTPELLEQAAQSFKSIQLPVYMHLYSAATGTRPHEGGLVKLAENGKTEYLCQDEWTPAERDDVVDSLTPVLIKTLIRHMLHATEFPAIPGTGCRWCDFKPLCGQ